MNPFTPLAPKSGLRMASARSTKIRHSSRDPGGGSTAFVPYGSSCMLLVNASKSLRSSQCTAGNSQWAWR